MSQSEINGKLRWHRPSAHTTRPTPQFPEDNAPLPRTYIHKREWRNLDMELQEACSQGWMLATVYPTERLIAQGKQTLIGRMPSSVVLRRVALIRTDVWEERSASISRVRRLLVTASIVPSTQIRITLMIEGLRSSETSVLTRATRRNNPENGNLHSHCRENLKSYKSW
jgi:hypothetical protein